MEELHPYRKVVKITANTTYILIKPDSCMRVVGKEVTIIYYSREV